MDISTIHVTIQRTTGCIAPGTLRAYLGSTCCHCRCDVCMLQNGSLAERVRKLHLQELLDAHKTGNGAKSPSSASTGGVLAGATVTGSLFKPLLASNFPGNRYDPTIANVFDDTGNKNGFWDVAIRDGWFEFSTDFGSLQFEFLDITTDGVITLIIVNPVKSQAEYTLESTAFRRFSNVSLLFSIGTQ